jgi:GT2 family glycosyltransferase
MSAPRISVVVPTCGRLRGVQRLLDGLARQTIPADEFEAVIVADGAQPAMEALVRACAPAFALRYCEQEASGAAAARNRGARLANAPLVLFLDDDMEPAPQLLAAHLAAHRDAPDSAVLGCFPIPARADACAFARAAKQWWDDGFVRRSAPEHRFEARDLCSGNVSLPRALFAAVGGFDERFEPGTAGEDTELGVRLLAHGARFRFAADAVSLHHDVPTPARMLQRARAEGAGHVRLAHRHPELFWELNLSRPSRLAAEDGRGCAWRLIWRWPWVAAIGAGVLRTGMFLAGLCGRTRTMLQLHAILRGYAYWCGMRSELGSVAAWQRLRDLAPREPEGSTVFDVDLSRDLPRLDALLARRVDGVRILWGGVEIGRMAPRGGVEPLRAPHVRRELADRHAAALLGEFVLERLARGREPLHRVEWGPAEVGVR